MLPCGTSDDRLPPPDPPRPGNEQPPVAVTQPDLPVDNDMTWEDQSSSQTINPLDGPNNPGQPPPPPGGQPEWYQIDLDDNSMDNADATIEQDSNVSIRAHLPPAPPAPLLYVPPPFC